MLVTQHLPHDLLDRHPGRIAGLVNQGLAARADLVAQSVRDTACGLAVITLGTDDELTTLRAYESGSDHHLPATTGYVLLRTVIATVIRRVLEETSVRHLHAGAITVDLTARTVTVADNSVHVRRLEFELLAKFAADPVRVFSKHELARCIWRGQQISQRTVDSHIARLRTRLTQAGAGPVLITRWGQGWALTSPG